MLLRSVVLLSFAWTALGQEARHESAPSDCSSSLSESESLYRRGIYSQAAEAQRRAVKCQEKSLSPRDPDLAASYDRLAELLQLRRRYRDAETLLKKALAIWSDNPEGNAANLAEARNGLALVYYHQRRYREAEAQAREAKTMWERADGPGSFGVASALNTLGFLFGALQDFPTADRTFLLALDIQKAGGRRDLLTASLLHNLATTRYQTGFAIDAEALYRESLCLQEELLSPEHPLLRKTIKAYAKVVKGKSANRTPRCVKGS
jgi:tetratricopeptide (TPR) repeat protein